MEKRKKKTAAVLVGILSAACVTTGAVEAISQPFSNNVVNFAVTANASETLTKDEQFIADATYIAEKAQTFGSDADFITSLDVVTKYVNMVKAEASGLTDRVTIMATPTGYASYPSVQSVFDKANAMYDSYNTYANKVLALLDGGSVPGIYINQVTKLKYYQKSDSLAYFTQYSGYTADEQALVDTIISANGYGATSEVGGITGIETKVNTFFNGLDTKVADAQAKANNIYKNGEGKIVLGSEIESVATGASKNTITAARTALDAIYGKGVAIDALDKDVLDIQTIVVNAEKEYQDIVKKPDGKIALVNADILKILANFDADKNCVTYVDENGDNQILAAKKLYDDLFDASEQADNDEQTYFNNNYASTKTALDNAVNAYNTTVGKITALEAMIETISGYAENTLFKKGDESNQTNRYLVDKARKEFEALPEEISSKADLSKKPVADTDITKEEIAAEIAEIQEYVTNYEKLVNQEITIAKLDAEVQDLKDNMDNIIKPSFISGQFTNALLDAWEQEYYYNLTAEGQQDVLNTDIHKASFGDFTYFASLVKYRNYYGAIETVVGPVNKQIRDLNSPEDITIEDKPAIEAAVTAYEALAQYKDGNVDYRNYVGEKENLDLKVSALKKVTAGLDAWIILANALPEIADLTLATSAHMDAITKVHKIYKGEQTIAVTIEGQAIDYTFLNSVRTYVENNAPQTSAEYKAYEKYTAVYDAMYGTNGLHTKAKAVLDKMNDIPQPDPTSDGTELYSKYTTAKNAYEELTTAITTQGVDSFIKTYPIYEGETKTPWQKYMEASAVCGAYDLETEINKLNVELGGVAWDFANSTYTLGTVPTVKENIDEIYALYNKIYSTEKDNEGFLVKNPNSEIRNAIIIKELKADADEIYAKYQGYQKVIDRALNLLGENDVRLTTPTNIKNIELTGGVFEEKTYSIASIKAFLTTSLDVTEQAYMKAEFNIDSDYVDAVKTLIDKNIADVKNDIDAIVARFNTGDMTTQDKTNMETYIKEYDENVYSVTQKSELEEKILLIKEVQAKTQLVDYIQDTIDQIIASPLNKESYATARVLKIVFENQELQIKNLVTEAYANKLDNAIKAYEQSSNVLSIEALNTAINNIKTDLANYVTTSSLTETLKGYVTQAEKDILQGEIDAVEKALEKVQEAIEKKADSATVNAELADLLDKYNTAKGLIDDLKNTTIPGLDTRIKALEGKLAGIDATVKAEIDAVKAALEKAQLDLNEAIEKKADSATILEKLNALEEAYKDADSVLKLALQGEIDSDVAELKDDIEELINNIKNQLQEKDTELSASLDKLNKKVNTAIIILSTLLAGAAAAIVVLFIKKK